MSGGIRSVKLKDSGGKYISLAFEGLALSNFLKNLDVTGFLEADLLYAFVTALL